MAAAILMTSILSVRVNSAERAMLEAAAEQGDTSFSAFVRRTFTTPEQLIRDYLADVRAARRR